jgi:hypothetical protein
MTQYQATPDYYRDYIEHGWAKDAAAKVHKYIERWKNAAGKWVYRYKKPESRHITLESEMASKWLKHPGSNYMGAHSNWARGEKSKRWKDVERARLNAKRAFVRKGTGYSGSTSIRKNLTSKGYSGSRGSNLNNKATSNKLKNRSYYYDKTGNRSTVPTPRNYGNLSNRGYSDSTGFDSKRENNWFVTDTRPGKLKIGNGPEKYEIFNIKKDKNGWTRYDRKKRTKKWIKKK